ncbi:MAG TPA: hypothetical protein VK469_00480 [Candidatus Kapabacteria bacterium]|nr:hypothetical protein [Candidatus Kapabacteria bacterium]
MEKSPTVAHAILEFFSRYLYSNQDLIETEIKRNQDKITKG